MIFEVLELIARTAAAIGQALFRWLVKLLGTRTVRILTESGQYTGYQEEHRATSTPNVHFFVIYEFTARGKGRAFRKQPTGTLAEGSEIFVHFWPFGRLCTY